MSKDYFVYILASKRNGTLYTGITGNLAKRVYEHKMGRAGKFTRQYNVKNLVYYEVHEDVNEAILRETQIKRWRRDWKIQLIERNNPQWIDLYPQLNFW